ncbi:MAG: formamidopyrimidine DNA glycosylase [Proteobacteria bacterium]|nr:MAG: formamidopyrimidine DNA glycosylase [Pseudomonadota bacterium]
MPEGDTVHKLVNAMRPLLEGRALAKLWLRDRGDVPELAGERVAEVAALGKHFLFVLGERAVLHVHLGMNGKWLRYARGQRWTRSAATAVVRLDTADWSFVCHQAPVCELLRRRDVALHPVLSRLGPDLLAPEIDLDLVVARARRREARSAAELLLDQRVACGVGNVYKSEVLFAERVHPERDPRTLGDDAIAALYATARSLLRQNLGGWKRTTVRALAPGESLPLGMPRLFVYGRGGEPCLRCGARIASRLHGDDARSTYWCPRCQPAQGAAGAGRGPYAASHGSPRGAA